MIHFVLKVLVNAYGNLMDILESTIREVLDNWPEDVPSQFQAMAIAAVVRARFPAFASGHVSRRSPHKRHTGPTLQR
jgi:hypothetical protein